MDDKYAITLRSVRDEPPLRNRVATRRARVWERCRSRTRSVISMARREDHRAGDTINDAVTGRAWGPGVVQDVGGRKTTARMNNR